MGDELSDDGSEDVFSKWIRHSRPNRSDEMIQSNGIGNRDGTAASSGVRVGLP